MHYRQQSLIDPQDLGYRRFCRDHKLINQKIGTPATIDPTVVLAEEVELAVRHCLLLHFGSLSPHRILSYEQRNAWGYQRHYRELDAVVGNRRNPQFFVEIKSVTQRGRGLKTGQSQLQKSLAIAQERWRSLRGLLIEVAWDAESWTEDPDKSAATTLLNPLTSAPQADQELMVIHWSGQQLVTRMAELGAPLDPDILAWAGSAYFSQNLAG
ncbi:hypothetical protein [Synechococcus elongatus]|uniref:TnsA endonuclease N-terminal domain-containing protein n=1 Tax=Synechococcus elongatus PCC 11802 TaxID=2283154 RepID=A0AAT9JKX5_SYNEL|nr:hypothetical protein [Synechococcus elongatus]QFZ92263.1 hypothetical protein EKO22_07740 [Synechococcus elongatus PCC 11802]